MSSLPLDKLTIAIEVQLDKLRAEMGEANRIVGEQLGGIQRTTTQIASPFSSILADAKKMIGAFALIRIATVGINAGVETQGSLWTRTRFAITEVLNVLSFGLGGALLKLRNQVTGLTGDARRALRDTRRDLESLNATVELNRRKAGIQFDVLAAFAQGPGEKAAVSLSRARRDSAEEASRLQGLRIGEAKIQAAVGPALLAKEAGIVAGAFGGTSREALEPQLEVLEQILETLRQRVGAPR